MKSRLYSLMAVGLLLAASSCSSRQDAVETAQKQNEAKNEALPTQVADQKNDDSEFLTEAASGGMLEVELGKAMATQAVTPEAKQLGQQMVDDHVKADEELKALAARKNVTLPASLSEDHRKIYQQVLDEKGLDRDKKYLQKTLDDHEKKVELYKKAAQEANDPDVKAYAAKTLPTLEHHLDMVRKLNETVKDRK